MKPSPARHLTLIALLFAAGAGTARSDVFTPAGTMATKRFYHTATLLPSNGKVLIIGGYDGWSYLDTVELYDPVANTWSPAPTLLARRGEHTATLLPNGCVLIVGGVTGVNGVNQTVAMADIYNPGLGPWFHAAPFPFPVSGHTATLLPNGKVLVVGYHAATSLTEGWLYDPPGDSWSPAGNLAVKRLGGYTATLLPSNGKVLVAGGRDFDPNDPTKDIQLDEAELYDPVANSWSPADSLTTGRSFHTATLLPNGWVLVANGFGTDTAERYSPETNVWLPADKLAAKRYGHTATLLPDGKVLVVGGTSFGELYDPGTSSWSIAASLPTPAAFPTATFLPNNGKVLVAGGVEFVNGELQGAELYTPGAAEPEVSPTPTPASTVAPPTVRIAGRNERLSKKATLRIHGTASGAVRQVLVKAGDFTFVASGTTRWSARLWLKPGRNKLTATATGPGGTSAPARITVIQK